MIRNKSWAALSEAEIAKAAKLTPGEQTAVDAFVAAATALPKSICVNVSDYDDGDDGLVVSKRITSGMTQAVANIRKKSLVF